jgi:hypothetical protein
LKPALPERADRGVPDDAGAVGWRAGVLEDAVVREHVHRRVDVVGVDSVVQSNDG